MRKRNIIKVYISQVSKFLVVGGTGVIVNLIVFNLLLLTIFNSIPHGVFYASTIATLVAIGTNWLGNHHWAFSEHKLQEENPNKGVKFLIVSLASLVIPLACVWVSRYVLGFDSLIADNIANNVVGLAIGTVFRFTFYKLWVFKV
jgi:putative flippase GtrA